jgi:hypothetical protein
VFASFGVLLGQDYTIDWYTIDGGGAMFSTGGELEVSGTIGQPDAGGPLTGGQFELIGGFWPMASCTAQAPTSSIPQMDESLWRSHNNIVVLNYGQALAEAPGDITIRELLPQGQYGPDLSSQFTIGLDPGHANKVRIQENGQALSHATWYAFGNCAFEKHFVLMVGDASNDGRVLAFDVSVINSGIPCFDCPDDRRDISGDERVLAFDVSVTNPYIPSFSVPKPDGHACSP